MNANYLKKTLAKNQDKERAKIYNCFFKTKKGEYGFGDKFIGVSVPIQRKVASEYSDLSFKEIANLLKSPIHEHRLTSLIILVNRFKKSTAKEKKQIFDFYLKNLKGVNNWDLVDASAHYLVGEFLKDKKKDLLYRLASSKNLWERRISIVSTYAFIKEGNFEDIFKLSRKLFMDKEDLIHKAIGWMLREVGKKDESALLSFLDKEVQLMPRTSLRYSIERLEPKIRKKYLKVKKEVSTA